jgi:hypothetical protein
VQQEVSVDEEELPLDQPTPMHSRPPQPLGQPRRQPPPPTPTPSQPQSQPRSSPPQPPPPGPSSKQLSVGSQRRRQFQDLMTSGDAIGPHQVAEARDVLGDAFQTFVAAVATATPTGRKSLGRHLQHISPFLCDLNARTIFDRYKVSRDPCRTLVGLRRLRVLTRRTLARSRADPPISPSHVQLRAYPPGGSISPAAYSAHSTRQRRLRICHR